MDVQFVKTPARQKGITWGRAESSWVFVRFPSFVLPLTHMATSE